MNYFSKDYWGVSSPEPYKFIENKKFPFISMTARKRGTGNWLIRLNNWDDSTKSLALNFTYKKLTKDKYEEILYTFLRSNTAKHVILDYLFKGGWKE